MKLFEAVPNLAEGRSGDRLGAVLAAVLDGPGAHLLDAGADPDHHRAVLTLAGGGEELLVSLQTLYRVSLDRLDLRRHRGVHPRHGVVDVCPIVPLAGAGMAEAAELARRLGQWTAAELRLPVHLYGAAARSPQLRELPDLRRALRGPGAPAPDFGPPAPHVSGGVTVIGARGPLIAFNALLATGEAGIARAIARRLRAADGGMAGVRALGLELAGRRRAQVSMNLIDPGLAPPARVLERVLELAAELGTAVESCEVIGLMPRAAAAGLAELGVPVAGGLGRRLLEDRLEALGLLAG